MICLTDATDALQQSSDNINAANNNEKNSENSVNTTTINDGQQCVSAHIMNENSANIDTSGMSCSDESDVEVIDDVGVHYTGNQAPEEFQ